MFVTAGFGVDFADPTSRLIRANGNESASGRANNPQIEAEIAAWYDATSPDEEKTTAHRLDRLAVDHVLFAPLGVMLRHVSGIVPAPLPLFRAVSKTA